MYWALVRYYIICLFLTSALLLGIFRVMIWPSVNEVFKLTPPKELVEYEIQLPPSSSARPHLHETDDGVSDLCGVRFKKEDGIGPEKDSASYDWPWMAAVFTSADPSTKGYKHFCGATIITETVLITAAHCVHPFVRSNTSNFTRRDDNNDRNEGLSALFIGVGSSVLNKTTKYPVHRIIIHPRYSSTSKHHDIALLLTSSPLNFTETVRSICLPRPQFNPLGHYYTESAAVKIESIGWGGLNSTSGILQSIKMETIFDYRCNVSHFDEEGRFLSDESQICAQGSHNPSNGWCEGDPGGPLMAAVSLGNKLIYHLIGILSDKENCTNTPNIYTKITGYTSWIDGQLLLIATGNSLSYSLLP